MQAADFTRSQTPRIHTWSMKPPRGSGAGLDEPTLDQLPRPRAKVQVAEPELDADDGFFDVVVDEEFTTDELDDAFFFSEPPRPAKRRSSSGAGVVFAVTLVVTGAVAGFAGTRAQIGHNLSLPTLSDLGLR